MTSPRNILVLSLYYWPEKAGSAPPVQELAETLAAAGHQVRVLTARPAYPEMTVHADYRHGQRDREHHQGVAIHRLPQASYRSGGTLRSRLLTEGQFALRAFWCLRREPRPDVAIAVCPSILAVLAMRLAIPARVRRLAVVHDLQSGLAKSLNITTQSRLASLIERLERAALAPLDTIVTLSEGMAEAIRALGIATPVRIIPPTVDDRLIQPQPEPPEPIVLLYSGNIGRKQGLEQLLDLAAELQRHHSPARLIIRGDGNRRAALMEQAQARALNNLTFQPLRPAEHLSAALAEGHIHLVPQDPAGATFAVPSKLYSIMAAGRPALCTAAPDSPLDQLRAASDAFILCPPQDPVAFADAVERLIAAPAERARLGRNGRAYVEQYAGRAAAARAYGALVSDPRSLAKAACRHTA